MSKFPIWVVFSFCIASTFAQDLLIKHVSRPLQAESVSDALEPWETPISGFFIRSHHGVPVVDKENWILEIDGLVENPLKIRLKDLEKLPQQSLHAVLECSGNWRSRHVPKVAGVQWDKGAVGNAEWTGVSLAELLKQARVKPNAKFATVSGADKPPLPSVPAFVRSIPLSKLMDPSTLLALKMNREELPILHGGPLRLILPGWYGQNWMKWVVHINLSESEDAGFYMKKAYRMPDGNPIEVLKVQSLLISPSPDAKVSAGLITVKGKAFSGSGKISKVQVSIDQGKTWKSARVEEPHADGGWQSFEWDFSKKSFGKVKVISRATDEKGQTQPVNIEWNPSGYVGNAVDQLNFTVVKGQSQEGRELFEERCLICHTKEMIQMQSLNHSAWEKVVAKMKSFGASFTEEEQKSIVDYLALESHSDQKSFTDYASETEKLSQAKGSKGNLRHGETLYQTHCAACHGERAEGKLGPRLVDRQIPQATFESIVLNGQRTMPSFRESLKEAEVADLRAFLSAPSSGRSE